MRKTPARKVFLFSGHMIDAPDRQSPRFPAAAAPLAQKAIADVLQQLKAGPLDRAISSGACGGDLLFGELALQRSIPLQIFLPFDVSKFVETSVAYAGETWKQRFEKVLVGAHLHLMPDEQPTVAPPTTDPYERVNLWMLNEAQRGGLGHVDFICLWNGQGGDGPGGTQHMVESVLRHGGRVHRLDTTRLWA